MKGWLSLFSTGLKEQMLFYFPDISIGYSGITAGTEVLNSSSLHRGSFPQRCLVDSVSPSARYK